jgi:RNA-directed DNA polymerase
VELTYRWATYSHHNKPKSWIIARYFGQFDLGRQDRWVFGDHASGTYLQKFSWTRIVRHQMVRGTSSPDDPALGGYWTERRGKGPPPPIGRADLRLLRKQNGRCPSCKEFLLHADHQPRSPRAWEQWLAVTRKAMTKHHIVAPGKPGTPDAIRLIHTRCWRRADADSVQPFF